MSGAAPTPPAGYPPERHVLRDLGLWIERDASGARAGLALVPGLLGPTGDVRLGVLATLADTAAGELAARSARPGWIATSHLVLHRLRPARGGGLVARPELVRRSRSAIAIEVALADAAPAALGHAALGFAVLPAREGQRRMGVGADEPRTEFALPGSSLGGSLVERIGARCLDPAAGRFELALAPYAANSLGALQGGMLALLADLAGEAAGGAALGSDCSAQDLALSYLALARESPVRTAASVLRADASGALLRVEVRDGAGTLASLATVGAIRV